MHNDKGFTLVEVVVAVAIVAILSTSLFRMFVTSTYVNTDARLMDMANTAAVKQAEAFKANPVNYDQTTKYYDRLGNACTDQTNAAIMIESSVVSAVQDKNNNADGYGYSNIKFVNPDGSDGSFTLTTDCDVTITKSYEVDIGPSISWNGAGAIDGNALPIRVDFSQGGSPHTINLTNDSDAVAEFYVFDGNINNENFDTINTSDVLINTLKGSSSISFVPAGTTTSPNKGYTLTLTVSRLNKDTKEEMFTYKTQKYQ